MTKFFKQLCVATSAVGAILTMTTASLATPITSNLVLELRADAGVTSADHDSDSLTPDLVSSWADQSTSANTVSQSGVDSLKPQLITNILNGSQTFNAIRFDGTDDLLARTSGISNLPTNTSGGTIFMVYRTSQATTNQVTVAYGVNDSNRVTLGMATGLNWNARTRIGGAAAAASTATVSSAEAGGSGVPLVDTFYVQSAVWPGTTSAGLLSKVLLPNGTIVTGADTGTAAAGAFVPTSLNVGRLVFVSGAGTNFQGDVAEILFYNTALSSPDQASVFSYLGQKYGIVPEPSSLTLLAISLCGLRFVRRQKIRANLGFIRG